MGIPSKHNTQAILEKLSHYGTVYLIYRFVYRYAQWDKATFILAANATRSLCRFKVKDRWRQSELSNILGGQILTRSQKFDPEKYKNLSNLHLEVVFIPYPVPPPHTTQCDMNRLYTALGHTYLLTLLCSVLHSRVDFARRMF